MTKYIFVTGGVVSSVGKGIVAASLGRLLKNRGLKITIQEFDPYINVNPGTMSPYRHREVFITGDSAETDLDLGYYERFIDISLSKYSNVTTGKVYSEVLRKERKGEYLGATVQVIPHVTSEIEERAMRATKMTDAGVIITEVGSTAGDIESLPFLGALRQMKADMGSDNVMHIHTTLIPYLRAAGEMKAKPTQHSVKELGSLGIQPNILMVHTELPASQNTKGKLAQSCDVSPEAVTESRDVEASYSIPLTLQAQNMDQVICDHLKLDAPAINMTEWRALEEKVLNLKKRTKIALASKYVELPDAYISVVEALKHAGFDLDSDIEIDWVDPQELTAKNVAERIGSADGILVPGGFGDRRIEGKAGAIRFTRKNNVSLLGICLDMQMACVEFGRNAVDLEDAGSAETDLDVTNNIIDLMANQENTESLGGTLRLGLYPYRLKKGTETAAAYGNEDVVRERHRHRYGFNNRYHQLFEENSLVFSGISPDSRLVEIAEVPEKQSSVACQFHPELISRPNRPQRLIRGFVGAALASRGSK